MPRDHTIYDGLHVTDGDYRGHLISDLDDAALIMCKLEAERILRDIEQGTGLCPTSKYRGQYWVNVQNVDYSYWSWYCGQRRRNLAVYDLEIRQREDARRDAERSRQEQTQLAREDDDALFDDADQRLIVEHQILDRIEEHWRIGFNQAAFKAHPDHGGSNEAMGLLNLEKRIWHTIRNALHSELPGNELTPVKGKK